MPYFGFISTVIQIGWSFMLLVIYAVSSSMIPENLNEIKLTARKKINEHFFGVIPPIPENACFCLMRLEREQIIYIDVFGVFRLTKSFILPAIGGILTYDLLIINTFMNQNNND